MTDPRFGGSAGLLQRLRPVRIDVADLLEVAHAVLPGLATPGLRLDLVQRSGAGSLVVLEEDERRVRIHLGELADDMARAGVPPTQEAMGAALVSWVAHRPVTDAAAATAGVAVLDWSDRSETAIGWRVVVRRGDLALPWTPSVPVDGVALLRTRSRASGRAHDVRLDLRVEGPVALWSHPVVPVLSSAALVAPERMLQRIADAGLAMPDMHVVVTPRRPVACAGPSIAARLAGETTEASVTLPWRRLADLPWI
ncbi:hypothetical protein [Blastococcus haudaquaticus]|uniref:Uncharacterized protein n=1 Tax=Blastococcus haudaquaticus TaxID=1938745 RepID=A0A286H0A4_9ACTN|nr:hypothetical protein [Blastococcus haudaquaticus]SOE01205.1 hypothetical protein SAMN06272739_3027 [Blastococcus haudaquaticus]